jgi:hypothetical protein
MDLSGLFINLAQLGESVPASLLALRAVRHPEGKPSDPQLAIGAYVGYEVALSRYLFSLQLMAKVGIPPKVVGAIWSWPAVLRAHRDLVAAATDMTTIFGQLVMLGDPSVLEPAYEAGLAVGRLTQAASVQRRRWLGNPDFDDAVAEAGRAVRAYLLAVREVLTLPSPPSPDSEEPSGG